MAGDRGRVGVDGVGQPATGITFVAINPAQSLHWRTLNKSKEEQHGTQKTVHQQTRKSLEAKDGRIASVSDTEAARATDQIYAQDSRQARQPDLGSGYEYSG